LFGGIIDFGFAFTNFIKLQQIANDAAQYGAETNGLDGRSVGEISAFVANQKPAYWGSSPTIEVIGSVPSSDGQSTIKVVRLSFNSPMYTPFYQTFLSALTGEPGLKLRVKAAYQIPNNG